MEYNYPYNIIDSIRMQDIDYHFSDYHLSSDKKKMQWHVIHQWLANHSYWAQNIPFERVKSAGEHSFAVGIFHSESQIGYARIVTDYTSFGYIADVFIIEEHRRRGLSKILLECIMNLDWVKELRRLMLYTDDAHGLYRKFGFKTLNAPENFLHINKSSPYE